MFCLELVVLVKLNPDKHIDLCAVFTSKLTNTPLLISTQLSCKKKQKTYSYLEPFKRMKTESGIQMYVFTHTKTRVSAHT